MSRTREEDVRERSRLTAEYRELYDKVVALLFRHDPEGINFETNTDEYEPEVDTILPRLRSCHSEDDDVLKVVHEEFVQWFGAETAGPREHYARIAAEIWQLWRKSDAA